MESRGRGRRSRRAAAAATAATAIAAATATAARVISRLFINAGAAATAVNYGGWWVRPGSDRGASPNLVRRWTLRCGGGGVRVSPCSGRGRSRSVQVRLSKQSSLGPSLSSFLSTLSGSRARARLTPFLPSICGHFLPLPIRGSSNDS